MLPGIFQTSIKRYILVWVSIVVSACAVLIAALLAISGQLETQTTRLLLDSRAKEASLQLTNAILEERRADLLLRLTGRKDLEPVRAGALSEARDVVRNLDLTATTPNELALITEIEDRFREYDAAVSAGSPASPEVMLGLTTGLLTSIERFWAANDVQMDNTVTAHENLLRIVHGWVIVLIVTMAAVVVAGSAALVRRIIPPTLELSRTAARFREGDFQARARVSSRDELGALGEMFNDMAADIERREKARHEFIASVFHDIKNPTVNIGATTRMILRKSPAPEQARPWLERVLAETNRIEDLIQDLTDTVQVETGRLTLQPAELDLSGLVREIFSEQAVLLSSHRLEFESGGDCMVLGDRRRLERVIHNLLSNAVKYSPEKTTITLRTECRGDRAAFRITDRGVGIPPEDQAGLFQPFGRLAHTRSMAHGTGLGLYIVKRIVEAHGGSIRLESTPGTGTTVEIELPRV